MKTSELREMGLEEVKNRLEDLQEEAFNLRFQHVSGQLTTPIRLRHVRRDIAQVRTILREHELEMRTLAGGDK
ncbi:MAG: 50S ribosomal protein L29 [Gemmatimonadetes bacterium]|jgi:large subunit ribosomal protein L29|nr:50S ribosomal protein L29 [Gemmatimonadota bacterium]